MIHYIFALVFKNVLIIITDVISKNKNEHIHICEYDIQIGLKQTRACYNKTNRQVHTHKRKKNTITTIKTYGITVKILNIGTCMSEQTV